MNIEAKTGSWFEDVLHRTVGKLVLNNMTPISVKEVAREKKSKGGGINLYVHVPFCAEICSFCAFHRRVGSPQQQETYTRALETHIDDVLTPFGRYQKISSVFVGGGTPGLLSISQANRIISRLRGNVGVGNAQISYELHPENISEGYILDLQDIGVGRFSVGVQTLSNEERKILRRDLTSAKEDIASLQIMNQLGVAYNLDLMLGTPAQTQESWIDTIKRIISGVNPPEITIYQYVNAYGSETRKWIAQGRLSKPDLRMRREMYYQALEEMTAAGYRQTSTYSFSRDQSITDRTLLDHGNDFFGLGPRTYSRVGRFLFINPARTSDFKLGGNMADYVGLKVPPLLMTVLDRTFGLFAGESRNSRAEKGLIDLRSIKSEAVAQVYGILYYITNQPKLY